MAVKERDSHTGYMTTGHEWNGIKELNTPVPRIVYFFLITTALFSIGYWILMPAWPLGVSFTRGLLGIDQTTTVENALKQSNIQRASWTKRIETESYTAIQADDALMKIVRQSGKTLFGDNCAVCHGLNAKGSKGFPDLTARAWLWGGDPETLAETIRVGINADHPKTRISEMLGFGRNQVLNRAQVDAVIAYLRTLPGETEKAPAPIAQLDEGKKLFAAHCATCHGDDGKGKLAQGAPDLTDRNWIYGGDPQSLLESIWQGRKGQMPAWEPRLSATDRKILVLYLLDLQTNPR